jgi:putative membrane protein|tara:strand:+ start:51 stop:638 length:588 start_codon:yes stop_codon:yes gene_type:complete
MKKGVKILSYLMGAFLIVFLGYFILQGNYEFSGYSLIAGILFYVLIWANKYYDIPLTALWLIAIWIILHMLGGSVYIGGTKLYDLLLVNLFNGGGEFMILKYDQLIHAYCYIAIASVIYFMLKKHMKKGQDNALIVFTILAAIGVGLLNEVIEFAMVVFADAGEAVGGYYNTALDLVFNLIGAILGAFFAQKVLD